MSANRKNSYVSLLVLILLLVSLACASDWDHTDSQQQEQDPQAEANPDPQSAPGSEAGQALAQPSQVQPIQQPDPEPKPDPEPELDEVGKCAANKDVVIVNGDVIVNQTSDEATSNFTNLTCDYTTSIVSEASQPVVILYQWNEYYKDYPNKNESVFHWRFHGPIPPGGEKILFQELMKHERALFYKRLTSYVAIYDTPECKKHINSIEMMRYSRSVYFECDQYVPNP